MSSSPPLNDNALFHPEEFASAAAMADSYGGRFWIEVDPLADRSPGEWRRYEGRGGPWNNGNVAASAFDPVFRIVLDAMSGCRVSGLTTKRMTETADAPVAWLASHATRSGRTYDIDADSPGVRDDLDAWWWLVRHADVCIACDVRQLDAATLFTTAPRVNFRTTRFLSPAVKAHAREIVAMPNSVAIVAMPNGDGWEMVVGAARGLIGPLATEALRRCQVRRGVIERPETPEVAILATIDARKFCSDNLFGHDFEKVVTTALRRGEQNPTTWLDAIRTLAAAEGVAIAEGRARPTVEGGMAALLTKYIAEQAGKADPLSDATIQLAASAVTTILSCDVSERARWQSAERHALYRAELEGLARRLRAAHAARQARARAPNAIPLSTLRRVPERPLNWRTHWLHLMLDDAVAFIGAIRIETGATPLILMQDLSFRDLGTDWDVREMVSSIRGCPFDERQGDSPRLDWSELRQGQSLLIWWPDLSPRPVAHGTEQRPEIVSWGHAELLLRGATSGRVLRSEWAYPTGTEMKHEKFAGPGPWHDVDWKLLRRKVKSVRALVTGALGGVAPLDVRGTWTLPAAAASARAGERVLMGDDRSSGATLPP